jgi:hypothetical protein
MSMMMITMEIHGVTVQKTIPKCPQHWVRNPLCKRHPLRSCKPLSNFQVSSKRSKALFPEYLPTSIYTTMYPLGEKNGEETLTILIYRPHHHQLHTFYLLALIQYTLGVLVKRRTYLILAPLHQHKMGI